MFTCFGSTGSGVDFESLSTFAEHAERICPAAMEDVVYICLYEHADIHQPKITAPCSNLQTLELSGWALTTRASLKARFGWVVTCSVYMIIYIIV